MFPHRLTLCFFLLASIFSHAQHEKVTHSPQPAWVAFSQPDLNASQQDDASAGFYYLLVDNQDNLLSQQYYRRHTYKILNNKGVQDMADVTIDFDPEYQSVELHSLNIIRDGQILDKLNLERLQVVQRESNMERFLYDGSLTVIANLTDVRSGDIVDYSFTVTGANPVHEGRYQQEILLEFPVAVEHHQYKIYIPAGEKINFTKRNSATDPVIKEEDNYVSYTWKSKKLEPVRYENNVPAWYDPAAKVEVTQFGSWKEVVDQYQKHYSLGQEQRRQLGKKAEKTIMAAEGEGEFIDRAIRFVQDEIRYLGFENGLNSHKPRNPQEVLEKRYGDCKDKSFLLSEILQARGIEAYPMLVHSFNGRNITGSLPSANIFDHCVVQIDLGDGRHKYVDPTISEQGGTVEDLYFPDYRYGLVLKAGETELKKLPIPQEPETSVTETFELDGIGGGASMDVETIYRGSSADFHRRRFAENSRQSIQQDFTTFYSNLYPSITSQKNVSFRDYRERNEFIVYEQYRIDSIWQPGPEQNNIIFAEFYPLSLQSNLFPDKYSGRKMPYYIDPAVNVLHKTVVYTPEEWPISNESTSFGNDDFTYKFDVLYQEAKLELIHRYQSLNDHVIPENLPSYFTEHDKAQDVLSYSLSYDRTLGQIGQGETTSWLSIFLILITMGGTGFLCFLIYHNYDLPSRTKSHTEQKIGGWLVVIGIGLALTPLLVFVEFFSTTEYFDAALWPALFSSSENYALGMLLLLEILYNAAYLVFSVFVLVLFLQRRTIAPRMIIWLFSVSVVAMALDTFASTQAGPALTGPEEQEMYTELAKTVLRSIIWIPYFIFSERVRETFTKTRTAKRDEEAEFTEQPPVISV